MELAKMLVKDSVAVLLEGNKYFMHKCTEHSSDKSCSFNYRSSNRPCRRWMKMATEMCRTLM